MANGGLFYNQHKEIGGVIIDAVVTESYSFSNSVTQLPVEDGSEITDNVTESPDVVAIEGYIGHAAFGNSGSGPRPVDAYKALLELKRKKQPITLILGLDTFDDMIITDFAIKRDKDTGANLSFAMSFQKILVISSKKTSISAEKTISNGDTDQTAGTANNGTGSKTKAPSYYDQQFQAGIDAGVYTQDERQGVSDMFGR
jgi:hypothetical protein